MRKRNQAEKQKRLMLNPLVMGCVFALISVALGCGQSILVKDNRRANADAKAAPKIALEVESTLRDALKTNGVKHSLKAKLAVKNSSNPALIQAVSRFVTTITVTGPSGLSIPVLSNEMKAVPSGEQVGEATSWEILLADSNGNADGVYTVTVSANPPSVVKLPGVDLPDVWTAKVSLDSIQPIIAMQSDVVRKLSDGSRSLTAFAWVSNKSEATCKSGELRSADASKNLVVEFSPSKSEEIMQKLKLGANTPLMAAVEVAVPTDLPDPLTLSVKCTDAAGNSGEFIQPVGAELPKFSFTANLDAKVGKVPGAERQAAFVKPAIVKALLTLADPTTGDALSPEFVASMAPSLRLSFTERAPTDLDDLNKMTSVLWSQPFATAVSLPLPSSYEGEKTIYVSLVAQEIAKNKQTLVGTVPVNLYAATAASSITWVTKAQFIPFSANVPIGGRFVVVSTQAPLLEAAPITLEYTTNNETWTALQAKITDEGAAKTIAGGKEYTYSFGYPLANEQPFRIRVKAQDIAGLVGTSAMSAQLLGKAGLATQVLQAERDACASAGVAQSKFKPWFASSVLCQYADVLGQRSGLYHAQVLLQNRGGAPVQFYSTTTIAPGMGYRVLVDGVQVAQARLLGPVVNGVPQPPAAFSLSADTTTNLLNFALQDQWLLGSKVVLQFDIEDTGVNSIANSCYAQGVVFPEIVVKDSAAGLTPVRMEMPCDTF